MQGWKLGLKALAIYRDGSKTAQALRTDAGDKASTAGDAAAAAAEPPRAEPPPHAARAPVDHAQVLDRRARGLHHGRHVRGRHGRRDLPDRHRQGGLDAARHDERVRDVGLDRAPVRRAARDLVRKFSYMRFDPEGITGNPEIPFAKSMPDYIMRWLASRFCDADLQEELGILTPRCGRGRRRRRRCCAATPPGRERRRQRRQRRTPNGGNGQRRRPATATRERPRPARDPSRPPRR